ncbi:MAG: hypothetical protein HeimC3_15440 [Candidatus Heimdallarchaeota archaeon LC_3]|nr:MAG: hypothetical protein HeimC3_15440 [Candidatus Heimdallarchaeota archaeon LC_3]
MLADQKIIMVLISRNKKAFKSVSFFFIVSIFAALLFLVISYQFEIINFLEFSIIFRFISLFFLIISALFGFSLGQISVRLYKDKSHKHVEEEIGNSEVDILQHSHFYGHQTQPEGQNKQLNNVESVITSDQTLEQNNRESIHCNECNKEIYNPYQCKQCLFYFCSDHFLIGDHICS